MNDEIKQAKVLSVGNKYVIKRKNLKKYALRYEKVEDEEKNFDL